MEKVPTRLPPPSAPPRLFALVSAGLVVAAGPPSLEAQAGPGQGGQRSPAETIASDRPGIGTGSWIVAPGVLQVEGGAARSEAGPATVYRMGELLLRYGLGGTELRAGLNSLVFRRNGADQEGLEDLSLGIKTPIGTSSDGVMRISALLQASLPTGNEPFTADEVLATAALLADWDFEGPVGLSANGGYTTSLDAVADETWSVSVTPTYAFPSVEGLGVYGGWAATFPPGETIHFVEGGFTYLPGADTQLDVNGGWDPESGDFFVGLGVARRWR